MAEAQALVPRRRHAVRVHAMRIANTLANFKIEAGALKQRVHGMHASRNLFVPHMEQWPFVDMDPLLGNVEEFLVDDGARATWPIDFANCIPTSDTNLDWRITYSRSMSLPEARKCNCRVFSPKMLSLEQVSFQDGQWDWGTAKIALLNRRWVDALRGPVSSKKDMLGFRDGNAKPIDPHLGDMIAGAALRHRYEWSAIFTFPSGLNLRFGTTATGVLAIFKDREKEASDLRRAPILHWVRQHWRRGQTTAETIRQVKAHMRGKEQFVWSGIPVTVVPAEYEIETGEDQVKAIMK